MIKKLAKKIQDLEKELSDVQKNQAVLRVQPCRGDLEMREKDGKMDALTGRAAIIRDMVRDLTRKRQLLLSESTQKDREPLKSSIISIKREQKGEDNFWQNSN
jgi:hypothetical protein